MNIFYLDADPRKSALSLVDKHVVKMTTETLQLMSTAHRLLDGDVQVDVRGKYRFTMRSDKAENLLYKITHVNHPSAVWARATSGNYSWLFEYLTAMCDEYEARYGKTFKCIGTGLIDLASKPPKNIPRGEFSPPTLAMPDIYKVDDAVKSYRRYYAGEKWKFAKWKHDQLPDWMIPHMREVWHDKRFGEREAILEKISAKRTPPADYRILQCAMELTNEVA